MGTLKGKKGLIVGIANEGSIAWGCAKAMHEQGAELAVTYLNEKAKPYVEPLAEKLEATLFEPYNVTSAEDHEALFKKIEKEWGKIDFLVHSIAFAPMDDLHGRVVDCSAEGFSMAMDISCHSLMRMCKAAEPMMKDGGSVLAMTYYGAEKIINKYNLMGPVKAALESSSRYLADELGESKIRVNCISPGPIKTRAASGLAEFDKLLEQAAERSPLGEITNVDQVGQMAAFLVSDGAKHVTGQTIYVDAGYSAAG